VSTNYYVSVPSCPDACQHCTEVTKVHLGKTAAGWPFLFRAQPGWNRKRLFGEWVKLASSGRIEDEYGDPIRLSDLLARIEEFQQYEKSYAQGDMTHSINYGYQFSSLDFT
jgi:hypothetical protein